MGTSPEQSCGVSPLRISRRKLILSVTAGSLALAVPVVYLMRHPRKPKPFTVTLDGPFPAKELCTIKVPPDVATSKVVRPESVMLMWAGREKSTIIVRFECLGPIAESRRIAVSLCLKDSAGRVLAFRGPEEYEDARFLAQHPQRLGTLVSQSSPINDSHFRVPSAAVQKTSTIELTFCEV